MRWVARAAFALLIPFNLLMLLVVHLGTAVSAPPASLNALDACALPCWRDIIPRRTSVENALTLLEAHGYLFERRERRYRLIVYRAPDAECSVRINYVGQRVTSIALTACSGVRLGDLMTILGAPQGILPASNALIYRDGRVIVTLTEIGCHAWFRPEAPILSIHLNEDAQTQWRAMSDFNRSLAAHALPWHGFARRGHYLADQPGMLACQRVGRAGASAEGVR